LTFAEADFNSLGYKILNKGRPDEAIRVFRINTALFPRSSNVFDSLGEAYMRAGDTKRAVENYRKALELNPENANARAMLKKLEKKSGSRVLKESA
jgi:Tfp pilus assembly protein PilF